MGNKNCLGFGSERERYNVGNGFYGITLIKKILEAAIAMTIRRDRAPRVRHRVCVTFTTGCKSIRLSKLIDNLGYFLF